MKVMLDTKYLYRDHQAKAAAGIEALQRLQGRGNRHFMGIARGIGVRCCKEPVH